MPRDDKKELFIVVDKNDRIIGYRTRHECHHNPKIIHRAVDIVIFNKKGQVLLQKRSQYKDTNPGFFGLSTAGHVAVGETYKQTAIREMVEEIGVQTKLIKKGKHIYQDERETEMTTVYIGNHDGPFKIDKQEVESIKFYTLAEVEKIRNKITPGALFTFKKLGIIK